MILDQDDTLLAPVENTPDIWAEIRYAVEHEDIHHLSDLMLRRVRIGLLLPNGGLHLLDKIETLCRPFLAWDRERWEKEKKDYADLWQACYSPPEPLKEP
jgi:glycerol-3-phosphate dehydrogenase